MTWLELCLPLVKHFEGCEKRKGGLIYPYLDTLAKPAVWTRGYGRTYGISAESEPITPAIAAEELAAGLDEYAAQVLVLSPALASKPGCLAAVVSWAWNCGVGAFRRSRLRRAINAGQWEQAAEYIKTPRTAGGVELRGLARRRDAEHSLFANSI